MQTHFHHHPQPNRFKSPLAFVDLNTPNRQQLSPSGIQKVIMTQSHKLKRRVTTVIDYNQGNCNGQRIKINYKENVAPPQSTKISFAQRSHHEQRFQSRNQIFQIQPFTVSGAKQQPIQHPFRPVSIQPFSLESMAVPCFQTNLRKWPQTPAEDTKVEDFQKIKQLGKGKFGTVWLAKHKKTSFICAMKIIKKSVVRQQKVQHQVAKEIRIHNALKHINIIAFYGYFHDQDNFYILTEFATGGQVYSLLRKNNRLNQEQVSTIVKQTADGLQMMHNLGFIHRDIKPENLVLQFNTVKICDLGWAAQCSQNQMRKSVCGTPLYYSPEIVEQIHYNSLIDVWTLGLLAYELLVGRIPFKIWSQFDLHVILNQQVTFPDYIDLQDSTKNFIFSCLQKKAYLRPKISTVKTHPFISKKNQQFSLSLHNECQSLF